MAEPLDVKPEPCLTCPYRKDVPSGVWHREEYEKLRAYDDNLNPPLALFLCHQTNVANREILCKGWVMVHRDSIASRMGQLKGEIDATAFTPCQVELHESGNAAADFGEMDVKRPKKKARKVVEKLHKTRSFKLGRGKGKA